jgi:hypothetical protein
MVGNAAADLLLAGAMAFDTREAALFAIRAEWTSQRDYPARGEPERQR